MPHSPQLLQELARRFRAELRLKLWTTLLGTAIFFLFYVLLQRAPIFPVHTFEPTFLDRRIPFAETAFALYFTTFIGMPLAGGMAANRRDWIRFCTGASICSLVAFACFLLYPVAAPIYATPSPIHQSFLAVDKRLNSVPSLHAAFALYASLFGLAELRPLLKPGQQMIATLLASFWVCGILYATIATRQHWAADLPFGLMLGLAAYLAIMRGSAPLR